MGRSSAHSPGLELTLGATTEKLLEGSQEARTVKQEEAVGSGRPGAVCGSPFPCLLSHYWGLVQASVSRRSLLGKQCSWDELREPPLPVCAPKQVPHWGIKTPNALGLGRKYTLSGVPGSCGKLERGALSAEVAAINSSHHTRGRGEVQKARPSDSVRGARKPDVCENPWFLNANMKSKLIITFSELYP